MDPLNPTKIDSPPPVKKPEPERQADAPTGTQESDSNSPSPQPKAQSGQVPNFGVGGVADFIKNLWGGTGIKPETEKPEATPEGDSTPSGWNGLAGKILEKARDPVFVLSGIKQKNSEQAIDTQKKSFEEILGMKLSPEKAKSISPLLASLSYGDEESQARFKDTVSELIKLGKDDSGSSSEADFLGLAKKALSADGKSTDEQQKVFDDILSANPKLNEEGAKELRGLFSSLLAYSKDPDTAKKVADYGIGLANSTGDTNPDQSVIDTGLAFLKDKAGISQEDIDKLKTLYQQKEEFTGKDGNLDYKDIASIAASLSTADQKTLGEASRQFGLELTTKVRDEAYKRADEAKASPEYQAGLAKYHNGLQRYHAGLAEYQRGAARAARFPILANLFFDADRKLAQGAAELAQGRAELAQGEYLLGEPGRRANQAIQAIQSNVRDDINPTSRMLTALEVQKQLIAKADTTKAGLTSQVSPQTRTNAMRFFAELKNQDPAKMSEGTLDQARRYSFHLDRADIEAGIASSLGQSQDVVGPIKDTIDGYNKYLDTLSNRDARAGATKQNLESIASSEAFAERVLNQALAATGLSTDANGQTKKIPLDQAVDIAQSLMSGEIKPQEIISKIKDAASTSNEAFTNPQNYNNGLTGNTVEELKRLGMLNQEQIVNKDNQQSFSAYTLNGKNYLGYKVKDPSNGQEIMAYVDKDGQGIMRYLRMDESHKSAYQASLRQEKKSKESTGDLKIDFSGDRETYTDRIAKDYFSRYTGPKKYTQEEIRGMSQKHNFSAFTSNGNTYLGYLMPDGKLAYMDSRGGTYEMNDKTLKASFYQALTRDGKIKSAIPRSQELKDFQY